MSAQLKAELKHRQEVLDNMAMLLHQHPDDPQVQMDHRRAADTLAEVERELADWEARQQAEAEATAERQRIEGERLAALAGTSEGQAIAAAVDDLEARHAEAVARLAEARKAVTVAKGDLVQIAVEACVLGPRAMVLGMSPCLQIAPDLLRPV